jgi:hypothetical protein
MPELNLVIKKDQEEPEAAEIFVDGTIESADYQFLLDTGAAVTRVKYDAYNPQLPATKKERLQAYFPQNRKT